MDSPRQTADVYDQDWSRVGNSSANAPPGMANDTAGFVGSVATASGVENTRHSESSVSGGDASNPMLLLQDATAGVHKWTDQVPSFQGEISSNSHFTTKQGVIMITPRSVHEDH